jgi:hypothetical protein
VPGKGANASLAACLFLSASLAGVGLGSLLEDRALGIIFQPRICIQDE